MRDRGNAKTLDLLGWEPPEIVRTMPEYKVRASTFRDRLARAVAVALDECGSSRAAVAQKMSAFLGESVSKSMIDAYASQAREEHTISTVRLVGLVHATGDMRLLQVLAQPFPQAVIPDRYLPAIQDAMLDDKIEEMTQLRQQARRQWKGARR